MSRNSRNKTSRPITDNLRVRVYNVRFGDAILVSVPDRSANGKVVTRHILIDVGNVLSGRAGDDSLFEPVIRDVLDVLAGKPLDLYIMTHEHLDHVQGLLHAAEKLDIKLSARYSWLTASAEADYYDRFLNARRRRLEAADVYDQIARFLAASPERTSPFLETLLLNNNPRSTSDCVEFLRSLAQKTSFIHRGSNLRGTHPFKEATFEVLAPEQDTSEYYGKFQPMALGVSSGNGIGGPPTLARPIPPAGVDAGAFYNLVDFRGRGYADNMLAIDRAANDSSIVFTLEWRGWRLLFPGDAEHRSWRTMDKNGLLQPIHFLKVGHHGSHNGTPPIELLDKILPVSPPDERKRYAVLSTCEGAYNNVPHRETMTEIGGRCTLYSVLDLPEEKFYIDVEFAGERRRAGNPRGGYSSSGATDDE
jgi:beta-lactamase superfamily II metal-dependent hydrolase